MDRHTQPFTIQALPSGGRCEKRVGPEGERSLQREEKGDGSVKPPMEGSPKVPSASARPSVYLMDPGGPQVGAGVDHVYPGRDQAGKNETVALLGGVSKAAAAGVPAGMVQLVVNVGHRQAVDDLRGGRVGSGPYGQVLKGLTVLPLFGEGYGAPSWILVSLIILNTGISRKSWLFNCFLTYNIRAKGYHLTLIYVPVNSPPSPVCQEPQTVSKLFERGFGP